MHTLNDYSPVEHKDVDDVSIFQVDPDFNIGLRALRPLYHGDSYDAMGSFFTESGLNS